MQRRKNASELSLVEWRRYLVEHGLFRKAVSTLGVKPDGRLFQDHALRGKCEQNILGLSSALANSYPFAGRLAADNDRLTMIMAAPTPLTSN